MSTTPTPKASISRGSKSFYFASRFFPEHVRHACWVLYRWCRYCDDQIDNATNTVVAKQELARLDRETKMAFTHKTGSPIFVEFTGIHEDFHIPEQYAFELLKGFEKDATGEEYKTLAEVEVYAYHVAGVVGLMMAKIMGAHSTLASRPAQDMGIAMQLTNIARDVGEDFARGRVYLPDAWLQSAGIDKSRLMDPDQREKVFAVVQRLLARADALYESGYSGLHLLPFRAACAVAIAASIYSAIGTKLRRNGPAALSQRTTITFPEKILLAFKGLSKAITLSRFRSTMEVST